MFNLIIKLLLLLIICSLIIAIVFFANISINQNKINTALNKCYENNNELLGKSINVLNTGKVNKEQTCANWKNLINDIDTCINKAYNIPQDLPFKSIIPLEHIRKVQQNKDRYNKSCKEYTDTLVR